MYESSYHVLGELLGGIAVGVTVIALFIIALAVLYIVSLWRLYKKAGKKGWESIVPFYSYWVLTDIAGLNWWWFLLIIIGNIVTNIDVEGINVSVNLVAFVASFNYYYNIAKKFNKSTGYAVATGLLPLIFIPILGLSSNAVYDKNVQVNKNGIFGGNDTNNSNVTKSTDNVDMKDSNHSFCGNCGTKLSESDKFCHNCGKEK